MKKYILLAVLFCLFTIQTSYSQTTNRDIGITVKALALDYISQNGGEFSAFNDYHTGMEIGFLKGLTESVTLAVPLKIAVAQSPDDLENLHNVLLSIDGTLRYNFIRPGAKVEPYALGGVGYVYESNELGTSNVQLPVGIGFNFKIHDRAFVTWQSEYRFSLEDDRNNLHHGLGFTVFLGPKDQPKEEVEEEAEEEKEALDSDMDGIIDELDLCPQEPGLEELDGCPDDDGDGIANFKDLCPSQAGSLEMKGCPDSDGDGVSDNDDECPNLAGNVANNGCPNDDTDDDGIPNDLDRCPTVAGPATNGGCPEVDGDGDGVPDNLDKCPNVYGSKNTLGCPDSDEDGVPDNTDQCPNIKGSALNNGCPNDNADSDNDGIPNNIDQCPDVFGPASNNGCPTPTQPTQPTNTQPTTTQPTRPTTPTPVPVTPPVDVDTDGDGVLDRYDNCPRRPGLEIYGGCPDTDGDGIDDSRDNCPTAAGPVDTGGCPNVAASDRRILDIAMRSVQFQSARAEIKSESFVYLTQIAEIMKRYPDFDLSIEGHTDGQGDATTNQRLSETRARACYNFLISSGVDANRMTYVGYGESRPIATNQTVSGRTLNRRVEFALVPR